MQDRLESSKAGRVAISVLVIAIVASIVTSSMTNGALKPSLLRYDQQLLALTGLDQRWDIFAPDPRRKVVDVRARIDYPNGRTETWRLPGGAPVVGAYWDSRWRKWLDNAMGLGPRSELWPGLAAWLARERTRPLRVTVTGRYYDQRPPGSTPLRGPWRDLVVYRLNRSNF